MGVIKHGILGGFRKKTGTVIGAYWRKLDVIRSLPRSSGKAATQLQLDQQQKFGLVTAILSEISELIDAGFYSASDTATPMNKAVSYHLKEAIAGTSPNFNFDATMLMYSVGKLELPLDVTASEVNPGAVTVNWTGNTAEGKYNFATDKATFLVYNSTKQKFVKVADVVARSVGEYEMVLPVNFVGDTIHVYMSFKSVVNKKLKSDSVFVDTVALSI